MKTLKTLGLVVLVVVLTFFGIRGLVITNQTQTTNEPTTGSSHNQAPTFQNASSTVFTLTTTSQRLLATSTPTKRLAATISPTNCTATGMGVFLNLNRDVAATVSTGPVAFASSTMAIGDYPEGIPVVQGSVHGITAAGTCTVIVTEWRSQY